MNTLRTLSNEELLGRIIPKNKARAILKAVDNEFSYIDNGNVVKESNIGYLSNIDKYSLRHVGKLTETQCDTLMAAVELARRFEHQRACNQYQPFISCPQDSADFVMPYMAYNDIEVFGIILLNVKNRVIGFREISRGSLSASIVHPREVFKPAILNSAAAIILVHNHPSGICTPSREDLSITERIVKCGKYFDIPVLDHIIIGERGTFSSLKDLGHI